MKAITSEGTSPTPRENDLGPGLNSTPAEFAYSRRNLYRISLAPRWVANAVGRGRPSQL
jgi:hypothetical protein